MFYTTSEIIWNYWISETVELLKLSEPFWDVLNCLKFSLQISERQKKFREKFRRDSHTPVRFIVIIAQEPQSPFWTRVSLHYSWPNDTYHLSLKIISSLYLPHWVEGRPIQAFLKDKWSIVQDTAMVLSLITTECASSVKAPRPSWGDALVSGQNIKNTWKKMGMKLHQRQVALWQW